MNTIEELINESAVYSVYQPIIDLQTGDTIAYEALARGPADSPFAMPDVMFAEARRQGLLAELDWECRASALRGALDKKMSNPAGLFINLEPDALESPPPPKHAAIITEAAEELRLVAEVTERAVAARPAGLLRAMQGIRDLGAGVAVDDVGADDRSLGILPFLRPDVVKLDLRLVQGRPTSDIASIAHAVSAHTERTGGRVLAEGIETEQHVRKALALGATLGQGWHFGRPGPLPEQLPYVRPWVALAIGTSIPLSASHTPFDILHGERQILEGDQRILLAMSRHLEERASELGPRGVILGAFQKGERITPATKARYEQLATTGAFVGVLAAGVEDLSLHGVARGELLGGDRLGHEWAVVVLGPHFSAALSARELEGEAARSFAFAVTHDRELVVRMAASLMSRLQQGADRDRFP